MTLGSVLAFMADGAWTVGFFLISIMIIVFVHEFGHYIVGRWSGIHAEVFSLGFGKPLFSRTDKHGTKWQVAAVPLGGYVKFLGDANASSANPDEETLARLTLAERRHTMHGAPLWARAATVLAGPMFNVLLTMAVFVLMISIWGVTGPQDKVIVGKVHALPGTEQSLLPGDQILAVAGTPTPDVESLYKLAEALPVADQISYQVLRDGSELTVQGPYLMPAVVGSVMSKSAAMDAGLLSGDVITVVSGVPIRSFDEIPIVVDAANGQPLTLTVWRAGESFDLTLTPRRRDVAKSDGSFETRWLIGMVGGLAVDLATIRPGPWETLTLTMGSTVRVTESSINGLVAIIRGQISTCNISGAITMAKVMGDAAQTGWESFLGMLAVMSLGIGIMNHFPIPVLDGGHLVFHAWEAISGKPPLPKVLERLTLIGLTLVLGLMAYALSNDLVCV